MSCFRTVCLWYLCGIGILPGCSSSPKTEVSQTKPEDEPVPVGPPLLVSVDDIHDQYWTKTKETKKKYRGQLLQVTGRVIVAGSNYTKEVPLVCLGGASDITKGLGNAIWCTFPPKEQMIRVKGTCMMPDLEFGRILLDNADVVR